MTSTPSAVLGLELQAQNDNTGAWWANANQVFQSIEDSIGKEVALATTGGDTALTVVPYAVDQSRCAIVRIGSGQTLLSLARITTARARLYFVTNETSAGSFNVQFGGNTSNLVTIPRNCGAWVRVRSDSTTTFASPLVNLTTGAIDSASLASGAFLQGANNLSEVDSAAAARSNLGLAIGTDVQAYDADLTSWASVSPSSYSTTAQIAAAYQPLDSDLTAIAALSTTAYGRSVLALADAAASRALFGLAYAAQSDQETGTSTATVVAPGTQKYHPGHPKAWVRFNSSGTILGTSFNVASVVSGGGGVYTITMSNAMSDTNYGVMVTANQVTRTGYAPTFTSTTVFAVQMVDNGFSGANSAATVVVFGDQ